MPKRRNALVASTTAGIVALVIYWRTCHPTITWWDSAQYSLAADTLGVPGPPGSLLLTILGWMVTRLPLGISTGYVLNLLAGVLAAFTIALVVRAACGLHGWVMRDEPSGTSWRVAVGIALGALPLAFSSTLWTYAVKFTPYVLTATFTGLILVALAQWWRHASDRAGIKWLFIVALLIGLDFSVHRTNALLVPGIVVWVLVRRPGIIASLRAWTVGVAGLLVGLAFHLLIMPMAARSPALNIGMPTNLSRLWDYASLRIFGGGFLVNVFPRRAGFDHQVGDIMEAFGIAATQGAFLFFGGVPLILAVYGLVSAWRKDSRLAVALLALLIITVLTTVLYFNIPESYFRPLDRHYLPCLVIFATISAFGAGMLVARLSRISGRRGVAMAGVALALIAAAGIGRLAANYASHDRSRSYFAYDFASNLLSHLPPNAILLTNGDNDTFPLWYLQVVEDIRTDVTVINVPLTNVDWFIEHVLGGPGGVEFSKSPAEMARLQPIAGREWEVTLPTPSSVAIEDTIRFHIEPTTGSYLLVQDQIALDIIETNRWRRPVMVATTVSPAILPWLRDRLRVEGLAYRFVTTKNPDPNINALETNLMDHYRYRGYNDPDVYLDETSRAMSSNLYAAFVTLAGTLREDQGEGRCADVVSKMQAVLPTERVAPSEQIVKLTTSACETR